ncbi:MAG: NAD(P)-dependent oxidoreductase, partial [Bacteroidota bacterium]
IVAKILDGFGCKLLGYDPFPNHSLVENYDLQYTDLDSICRKADIITLHCPLNDSTHYLIDRPQIAMMKKGVMLINTSRGALLHTKAVIDALKIRQIAYLGMDVYEEEKGLFFEDHSEEVLQDDTLARLLTFPNVLITSHQAFLTDTALSNIADTVIHNINCWQQGLPCEHALRPAKNFAS